MAAGGSGPKLAYGTCANASGEGEFQNGKCVITRPKSAPPPPPPAKEWKCPSGYTDNPSCTGSCENQCWKIVNKGMRNQYKIYTWRV